MSSFDDESAYQEWLYNRRPPEDPPAWMNPENDMNAENLRREEQAIHEQMWHALEELRIETLKRSTMR